jgi:hypothetical protein
MLIIQLPENEIGFFSDIISNYPDKVTLMHEHGFDGQATVQIIIDFLEVMLPELIAAIGLFLAYKANMKEQEYKRAELKLKERELTIKEQSLNSEIQKNNFQNLFFEIHVSDNDYAELIGSDRNIILDSPGKSVEILIKAITEALKDG